MSAYAVVAIILSFALWVGTLWFAWKWRDRAFEEGYLEGYFDGRRAAKDGRAGSGTGDHG